MLSLSAPPTGEGSFHQIYSATITRLYSWTTAGVLITALVSWIAYTHQLYSSIVFLIAFIGSFVVLIALHITHNRAPTYVNAALFITFTALEGLLISPLFAIYDLQAIAFALAFTAIMFIALTTYGIATNRDISSWSSFLFPILLGTAALAIMNIFIGSNTVSWIITMTIIPLFSALTIWDTKEAKRQAIQAANSGDIHAPTRIALMGAIDLYLNIINLFLAILRVIDSLTDKIPSP